MPQRQTGCRSRRRACRRLPMSSNMLSAPREQQRSTSRRSHSWRPRVRLRMHPPHSAMSVSMSGVPCMFAWSVKRCSSHEIGRHGHDLQHAFEPPTSGVNQQTRRSECACLLAWVHADHPAVSQKADTGTYSLHGAQSSSCKRSWRRCWRQAAHTAAVCALAAHHMAEAVKNIIVSRATQR